MQITRLPVMIKMPSFQKNVTIQEIVIHKSASTIIPTLCLTFSRTRILHRQLEGFTPTLSLPSYPIIPVIFITAKSFLRS